MVQKSDELSWFERMTKELENDPEYLREYIMLCSSQIKDQETKIAALEQRFDALSSKFAALVEEQTAIERERDELKEENETLRCHAHDAELAFERNAELKAENALLRKRLEPIEEWWDRNCSEYIRKKHQKWDASMYEAIEKAMELKEGR